jgi:hypothetical protein
MNRYSVISAGSVYRPQKLEHKVCDNLTGRYSEAYSESDAQHLRTWLNMKWIGYPYLLDQ